MPAVPRGLPLLPGRHTLPGAGGRRSAAHCGLPPGSVYGAGPGPHGGGVSLQEEQGEGGGGHRGHCGGVLDAKPILHIRTFRFTNHEEY